MFDMVEAYTLDKHIGYFLSWKKKLFLYDSEWNHGAQLVVYNLLACLISQSLP